MGDWCTALDQQLITVHDCTTTCLYKWKIRDTKSRKAFFETLQHTADMRVLAVGLLCPATKLGVDTTPCCSELNVSQIRPTVFSWL